MRMKFWEINREDLDRLLLVADRAMRELNDYPDDQRTLIRDLNACHSNGCPLDFKGLLEATMQDFSHDIYSIRQHINRRTGKLEGCFMPSYALRNRMPSTKR